MRALRGGVGNALLGVLGTLAALALAEAALRVLPLSQRVLDLRGLHEFRPDKPWLYGLRPGAEGRLGDSAVTYRINADGFRGPRYVRPKPPGKTRVVVLGDSVAFGYEVEEADAFPRLLGLHAGHQLLFLARG